MKVTACLICGNSRFTALPFGYDHEGQRLQGTVCRTCGIIFLNPQLSDEQITALYSKEYFEGDFRCGHTGSCLLYTSPSPRDRTRSRMPSSA